MATNSSTEDVFSFPIRFFPHRQHNPVFLPGVIEFDMEVVENTRTLFQMLGERRVVLQEVIDKQTSTYGSTSSIIEQFNKSLADYDMFGVNRNADVRYQNTRAEMLLALDEISDRWSVEKQDRDKWIQENRHRYPNKAERWLQIQWARKNKSSISASLSESLETRRSNFVQKMKGQIALREALIGKSELMFLETQSCNNFISGLFDSQQHKSI